VGSPVVESRQIPADDVLRIAADLARIRSQESAGVDALREFLQLVALDCLKDRDRDLRALRQIRQRELPPLARLGELPSDVLRCLLGERRREAGCLCRRVDLPIRYRAHLATSTTAASLPSARVCSAVVVANRWMRRATIPVQPV